MRALWIADLQLEGGVALGRGEYGEGSRFAEQEAMLDHVVATAVGRNVQLVGVLGDVFDRPRPSPWAVIAFQRFVRDLASAGIQVLCLIGNHDVKSAALPPALAIFKNDVHVSLAPSIFPYDGVVVATLPWAPMSTLTAKFDGNRDAMHDHAIGALVHAAHFLSARCREEYPGVPSVLVGHWAISGAALPTGLSTDILKEVIVPLEDLRDAGYSMVAFGHIHKPQVLSGDPPIIFCGSPWVMNWGEAGHDHGMWLYDTQGVLDFIPIPDKRFVTIDTDLLGIANGEWDQWSVDGAFVRLRWEMSEEAARSLDLNELRGHIERANALRVILQPRIISDQKARVVEMTEDLTLDESFRMWVESQNVDDTQALNDAHSEFVARVR